MLRIISTLFCMVLLVGAVAPANALNLSLDVVFTDSAYQVTGTDTFSDLLVAHNAANVISSTSVSALDGVDTSVYAGNISGDYSVLMTATLDINLAGSYEFQVGTDLGAWRWCCAIRYGDRCISSRLQRLVAEYESFF